MVNNDAVEDYNTCNLKYRYGCFFILQVFIYFLLYMSLFCAMLFDLEFASDNDNFSSVIMLPKRVSLIKPNTISLQS